mmetsp:Transcript_64692/g.173266  ORF Transcript_64692/g.173266 Transcript_64692/m.173266 type:complete len:202 (+) Transcript_64692:131-736(+)
MLGFTSHHLQDQVLRTCTKLLRLLNSGNHRIATIRTAKQIGEATSRHVVCVGLQKRRLVLVHRRRGSTITAAIRTRGGFTSCRSSHMHADVCTSPSSKSGNLTTQPRQARGNSRRRSTTWFSFVPFPVPSLPLSPNTSPTEMAPPSAHQRNLVRMPLVFRGCGSSVLWVGSCDVEPCWVGYPVVHTSFFPGKQLAPTEARS